jgi:hypothetical protein
MTPKKKVEFTLLPPRLVPLSAEQEEEAVRLLADLLLDVARKRKAEHSRPAGDAGGGGSTGSAPDTA